MTGILRLVMVGFTLFAVALIYLSASAWRNRLRLSSFVGFLASALLLTSSLLLGAITVGINGYRAFTQEALAATIKTEPLGPHHFRATVTLPDSSLHMFDLAGDAVYVDAHVLKWRPIGTFLGLQTAYELDRIAAAINRSVMNSNVSARCTRSPSINHSMPTISPIIGCCD